MDDVFDKDLMAELGLDEEDLRATPAPGQRKVSSPATPASIPGGIPASAPVSQQSRPSAAAMATSSSPSSPQVSSATTKQPTPAHTAAASPLPKQQTQASATVASTQSPQTAAHVPDTSPMRPTAKADLSSYNEGVAQDIPVQLAAVLGKQSLKLKDILNLQNGEVINFKKLPQDPIDLVANGKLVAKAELVMIEGKMGVRIIKLMK